MTEEERLDKNNRIREHGIETRLKRQKQICQVYTVKIQYGSLSKKQKQQLKMMFVETKWLYNDILNFSNKHEIKGYNTKTKSVNVKQPDGSTISRDLHFIGSSMKQSVLEQILYNIKALSTLKKKGYQEPGKLKFRSSVNSINLRQYGNTYKIIDSKHITIQKIKGNIRVNGLNQFYNKAGVEFANAKLLQKPDGYYVAITTYIPMDYFKPITFIGKEIGIDFGIKTGITLSNGEKFSSTIEETERLKRLQKRFSRQKHKVSKNGKVVRQGSNNSKKTAHLIAKEYQYLNNVKNDTANKLVHYLLQYETVYMQDEMISNWHKGLFGKQVQHSILGRVKSKLIDHPRVEVLKPHRPTTQYCPVCGNCTKHSLDKRTYHCDYCGYEDDRDVHAAKNMIRITKLVQAGYDIKVNNQSVGVERIDFKPVEILTSTLTAPSLEQVSIDESGNCLL